MSNETTEALAQSVCETIYAVLKGKGTVKAKAEKAKKTILLLLSDSTAGNTDDDDDLDEPNQPHAGGIGDSRTLESDARFLTGCNIKARPMSRAELQRAADRLTGRDENDVLEGRGRAVTKQQQRLADDARRLMSSHR
jgi:hypothetical protein